MRVSKKASKVFFFEKKKQKTFDSAVAALTGEHPTGSKSFLVLFFKKGLLALPVLLPLTAAAHAFLDHAQPRVGSTVQAAPKEVVLTFTQAVEPAFSRIEVSDAQGVQEQAGPVHGEAAMLVVPLRPLGPGIYAVRWHVISVDTHRTQGTFAFTVGR